MKVAVRRLGVQKAEIIPDDLQDISGQLGQEHLFLHGDQERILKIKFLTFLSRSFYYP